MRPIFVAMLILIVLIGNHFTIGAIIGTAADSAGRGVQYLFQRYFQSKEPAIGVNHGLSEVAG
jgi:hypothetical protein